MVSTEERIDNWRTTLLEEEEEEVVDLVAVLSLEVVNTSWT